MKKSSLLSAFTGALLIIALLMPAAAWAQAYRSQLHFLEEFAVRQYDRGNMSDANKEFQRILRIQPENTVAREYLKKIAAKPTTPAATKANIDEVISDISSIKVQLNDYEKDAKDLEYMIRNLITENDALYQSLYKRSREVVELREKFYGTPYGDIYTETMKDIPIDRVPQRLHPSNDILPDAGAGSSYADGSFATAIDTREVNALIDDINTLATNNMPLNTAVTPGSGSSDELLQALASKRDAMMDTTAATADKRQNLEKIKDELTTINTGLKHGADRYIEAINKIDTYYSSIKAEIARKNFTEQKLFSELVADYADRVKEIEELKRSTPSRDKGLTAFKPTLASDNTKIDDLKKVMALKDKQLSNLKSLLVQYKKELAERDAVIRLQQGDLSLTDKKLEDISKQVSNIEKGLAEGTDTINALNQNIAQTQQYLSKQNATVLNIQATAAADDVHVKEIELQNASLAARIDLHEKALGKSGMRNRNLERQIATVTTDLNSTIANQENVVEKPLRDKLVVLESDIRMKNILIDNLQRQLNTSPKELERLKEKTTNLNQTISETVSQKDDAYQKLDAATARIAELERANSAKDARLTDLSESVAQLQNAQNAPRQYSGARATDDGALRLAEMRLRRSQELLADAETNNARSTNAIADLNNKLASRDIQIEQLKIAASVNQGGELKAAKRQLSDQDAIISDLTHQNRALQDQLEKNLAAAPVAAASPSLVEKDTAIAELEKKVSGLEKMLKDSQSKPAPKVAAPAVKDNTQEILALQLAAKELQLKRDNALSAQMLAEGKLQQSTRDIAALQAQVKDLRNDIKTASELLEKKFRDNSSTLAEVQRLNDLIEKKNNEIADLQLKVRK